MAEPYGHVCSNMCRHLSNVGWGWVDGAIFAQRSIIVVTIASSVLVNEKPHNFRNEVN